MDVSSWPFNGWIPSEDEYQLKEKIRKITSKYIFILYYFIFYIFSLPWVTSLRQWLLVWVRQGCHRRARPVNGLNHINVLFPGSGGQTSEIKVPAALLPSEDPGKEPAPGRSPSLFPGLLASSLWSSSGVPPECACVQIVPFSKNTSRTGVRAPLL